MSDLQDYLAQMTKQAIPLNHPLSPEKHKRKKRKLRTKIPAGFDGARTARKMKQANLQAAHARESDPDGVEIGKEAAHFKTATGEQAEMVARFEVHFPRPNGKENRAILYPDLLPGWARAECLESIREDEDEQPGSEEVEGEEGV